MKLWIARGFYYFLQSNNSEHFVFHNSYQTGQQGEAPGCYAYLRPSITTVGGEEEKSANIPNTPTVGEADISAPNSFNESPIEYANENHTEDPKTTLSKLKMTNMDRVVM